ncbi:MAG: integron integrase [Nevskia sp.]|nr:integron integrase [Nevskia sp.]
MNTDSVPAPRLLDQVRGKLRTLHYSLRTEEAYIDWIKRYIRFHDKRHPRELGAEAMAAFLTHLATDRKVAASTQNQALAALLFLYRQVLALDVPWIKDVVRAKKPRRLPTVLSRSEVQALMTHLDGPMSLIVRLLYGSGMRLMECVRLRVKDVDIAKLQITVRDGKGGKDRMTVLPDSLRDELRAHLQLRRLVYEKDAAAGRAEVWLPDALSVKYPNAAREWGWQYVFVAQ